MSSDSTVHAPSRGARAAISRSRRWLEGLIHAVLYCCGVVSILTTVGIVVVLVVGASQFFMELAAEENLSPWSFFTDNQWTPSFLDQHFGIRPLLCGTLLVTCGAAVIAIPLGLATAIYLSEYATQRFRNWIKPLLEILAGIPSVVYGYMAVVFVSPLIRNLYPESDVFNAASASVVVAIMVLPTIVSLSEDVLRAVPRSLRDAAFALGSTKVDVTLRVVVPAALSGIVASFLLAISRALGETMAVTMAAGSQPRITFNIFESIETMTAEIVKISSGDTPKDSLEYKTIFAIGMTLFVCTLVMNILAQWTLHRMRQQYE